MKCDNARSRLDTAKKWLEIIKGNYGTNDDIIESQTEYFLIVCRSVQDYVISDFLSMIDPKMKNVEKAEITDMKKDYTRRGMSKHPEHETILKFLEVYDGARLNFENDLLVKYFIALRNWTVHTIFPHIYENQHGDNDTILTRRFQRNFVDYLGLESEGHLLLENGWSLKLESSDEQSIFDKHPLSKLTSDEKSVLSKKLENDDPVDLMNEYISKIVNYIEYFEKKY